MDSARFEELFQQMGEFTKMEEELPFQDFVSYYNDLLSLLQADYQDFDRDALIRAKGMTMIVAANAQMRAARKDANRKKFAKISEKAKFWEDAIALRLSKEGLAADELDQLVSQLWA